MARALDRWRALPPRERATLLALAVALPFVALVLRVAGYGRTRRWIERVSRRKPIPSDAAAIARAQRLAALADIAGRRGAVAAS
ncbi:MAG TPA: hypothetical protein VFO79_05165, partial [Xanthomonadales bacterium]|nr:hypothetical protein [Xanthomonadales bacterium]